MSYDDFIIAARARAEELWPHVVQKVPLLTSTSRRDRRIGFEVGARWGRKQALAQEPTDAEVDAGMASAAQSMPAAWWGGTEWRRYVEEILSAARAARRDEEKR